ncbi:MAG: hypothetical protein Q9193_006969 [Seirophora villosa]
MEARSSLEHYGSIILRMYRRQSAPPSLVPPLGVIPNYVNANTSSDQVTVTSLTLFILSTLFVIARMTIKLRVVKKHSWDDVWILFAWVRSRARLRLAAAGVTRQLRCSKGSPTETILALARAIVTTINAEHYYLGYHIRDTPPQELASKGEMQKNLLFIGDMLYLISIMSTKIAILLLNKAIFGIKRSFRFLCYAMMVIVASYCVIFFFIVAFNCNPVQKTWHTLTFTGPAKCFSHTRIEFIIGGFNIATDFIILIMPIPIILSLNLDSKRKLGVLAIFMREVIVVRTLRDFDQSWVTVPETVWL